MTMPAPPPVTGWRVTTSLPKTEIGLDGSPSKGLQVNYTTTAGGNGSVFVPAGQDSVDNIRALVAAAAAKTDAINSLTSDS